MGSYERLSRDNISVCMALMDDKNICPKCHRLCDKDGEDWHCNDCDLTFRMKKTEDTAKLDHGKPIPTHCPTAIIRAVMEVRQYGVTKYSDPDNWRTVSLERHKEAMLRHCLEMWEDTGAIDAESGIEHIKHLACNLAFILAMMEEKEESK